MNDLNFTWSEFNHGISHLKGFKGPLQCTVIDHHYFASALFMVLVGKTPFSDAQTKKFDTIIEAKHWLEEKALAFGNN